MAYAYRIVGDAESARDVVQETFLELCRADRSRIDGHLSAWLYTVCRNRALNVRKKDGRMAVLTQSRAELLESPGSAPSAIAEHNEQHRLVHELLQTMPEREQEVFRLKFGDGLTYREISKITNIPLATISQIVHKSIGTLREKLNEIPTPVKNAAGVKS